MQENQENMDSMQQYLGAACEVLQLDNKLLFTGSIDQYDARVDELTVSARDGSETPKGIIYHTPVKLHVQTTLAMNKVLLLYGQVCRCTPEFWTIVLRHTFSCAERRSSFRQPVSVEAVVSRGSGPASSAAAPCRTIDISLSGLCFISRARYLAGEKIFVSSLQLHHDGPIHSFACTVQRVQTLESGALRYGCQFDNITEQQEDLLFHDMFLLQVKTLNQQ